MRKIRAKDSKQGLRRRQRDVLRDVMLSARESGTWLSLEELAKLTHYPQPSISAQLRHLRKPRFGAYRLEKRPRFAGAPLRGEDFGIVWEYQLRRSLRKVASTSPQSRNDAQAVVPATAG